MLLPEPQKVCFEWQLAHLNETNFKAIAVAVDSGGVHVVKGKKIQMNSSTGSLQRCRVKVYVGSFHYLLLLLIFSNPYFSACSPTYALTDAHEQIHS